MANPDNRLTDVRKAYAASHSAAAARLLKAAVDAAPRDLQLLSAGVTIAQSHKDWPTARDLLTRATKLLPQHPAPWCDLGIVQLARGENLSAAQALEQSVSLDPNSKRARLNLTTAWRRLDHFHDAETALTSLTQDAPDFVPAWNNLAKVRIQMGFVPGAIAAFERAVAIPDSPLRIRSNALLAMNYPDDVSPETLLDAHKAWAELLDIPEIHKNTNSTVPAKAKDKLKVGFVSPDFRQHSVAYFVEPLFDALARDRFEVHCYADVAVPDAVTARLRSKSDAWRVIADMPNADVADLVRNDEIDILVDLAGHTAGERLQLFGSQAAPVQVTWLGYPHSTGLPQMNFRFVDATTDPIEYADTLSTEQLIRLPGCFVCYAPPAEAPDIRPREDGSPITFGSFNKLAKISDTTIALWSRVLLAVPDSQLTLKARSLDDAATQKAIQARFSGHGIDPGRLNLVGRVPSTAAHLDAYNDIDIALDTTPYCGTTTTCEALWMGTPVVSLAGRPHAARVGASVLNAAGLNAFVAQSPDSFVDIATELARNPEPLAQLRWDLRAQLRQTELFDAQGFASRFETALLEAWG